MRMYINNSTGNLCFLVYESICKFEMEYEWGNARYTIRPTKCTVSEYIKENFTEIGYFK